MADLKISEFTDGGDVQVGDQLAAARTGANVRVQVGSAAALDAGSAIGELPLLEDDGLGNPALPAVSGANLTNLPGSSAGFDAITSGTNTTATMTVGNGASIVPTGTGSIVSTASVVADESSDTTCFVLFATAASGSLGPKTNTGLSFNSATGILTATGFAGPLTGNASTATTATNVTVANEASDTTCFPLFATAATGNLPPKSNADLNYDSSTGTFFSKIVNALSSLIYFSGGLTSLIIRAGTNSNSGVSQPVLSIRNSSNTQTAGIRGDGLIFSAQIGTLDDATATLIDSSIANSTTPAGLNCGVSTMITWSSYTWWFGKDVGISRLAAGVLALGNGTSGDASASLRLRKEIEANTDVAASPNVLTNAESNKGFTNEGATAKNYHSLPTAVKGLKYSFTVLDADGMRITASSGDTIRIAASVSASAGYCETTTIGNSVTLEAMNATEWVATSVVGTWTVT